MGVVIIAGLGLCAGMLEGTRLTAVRAGESTTSILPIQTSTPLAEKNVEFQTSGNHGWIEAANIAFSNGSLRPTLVLREVPVDFSIVVADIGDISVTLDTSTVITFSDGVSGIYTSTLLEPTLVPKSSAPNYILVQLHFSPAAFPPNFLSGYYHPSFHFVGVDSQGNAYSEYDQSNDNLQVVEYITPTIPIQVITNTLSPLDVIQGEPVSFRINVVNPNEMGINLDLGTTFAITDTNGTIYRAALPESVFLAYNAQQTLVFHLEAASLEMLEGIYTPTLNLEGLDLGNYPFEQTTLVENGMHLWEGTAGSCGSAWLVATD